MATILIQVTSIITLSRLLPPEDFGIIAMIAAITAFMGLFRDMGLSTASIQKGTLSHAQTNMLFWLNLAAGVTLMLIVMALSPVIAWFYKRPEVQAVTILMAVTFLFSSLGAQHAALMKRELRFKPLAVADISGAAINLLLAIILALNGWGYWALAWGTVVGALFTSLLYFFFSNFKPGLPRKADGMRQLIGFGANVTAFEFFNYFHRNFDNILIGRIWGATALGFYSRAYQMMMLPIASLRAPINAVAFPVLSRLKNEPESFRRYYCQITSLLAFLSMPTMAFLTINAESVVVLALGKQWIEVAPIFVFLGLCGFIQPVAGLRGLVMLSLGMSRRYLAWGFWNAVIVCISFCIGVAWGSVGVACAYAIANYLILYPSMLFIFNKTPLSPRDFFSSIEVPATVSILASAGTILTTNTGIFRQESALIALLQSGICFLFIFIAILVGLPSGRKSIQTYLRLVKELRR